MERFRRLEIYPKGILILTGIIAVVFTAIYAFVLFGSGFWYGDVFLKQSRSAESTLYSGILSGEAVSVIVTEENSALFRFGSRSYGPFILEKDPASLPENHVMKTFMTGITIRRGSRSGSGGPFWMCWTGAGYTTPKKTPLNRLHCPDVLMLQGIPEGSRNCRNRPLLPSRSF